MDFSIDGDLRILKSNLNSLLLSLPELDNLVDTNFILNSLPRWNNLYFLYAVNNLLTYFGILLKSQTSISIDPNA